MSILEFFASAVPAPLFVVLYALLTCIPFPGTRLVAITAGALYGPFVGFGLVYVGALLGATLGFLASRHLFGRWLEPRLRTRFPRAFDEADANATVYLWSLRLSPLFSFALVHYVMGLTRIHLAPFLGVTALCSILYSALYVLLGSVLAEGVRGAAQGAAKAGAGGIPLGWIALLIALSIVPLVFRHRRKRSLP